MSGHHGAYYKGYGKVVRELKRQEAEARNALTPPERRRSTRRNRARRGRS